MDGRTFKRVEDNQMPGGREIVSLSEDGRYQYVEKRTQVRPADKGSNGISRTELRMYQRQSPNEAQLLGEGVGYVATNGKAPGQPANPHHRRYTCAEFKGQLIEWLFIPALRGIERRG